MYQTALVPYLLLTQVFVLWPLLWQAWNAGLPGVISPLAHHAFLTFSVADFLMPLCRTPLETHLELTCKSERVYAQCINVLFSVDNIEVHSTPRSHGRPVSQLQSSSIILPCRLSSLIILAHSFPTLVFICFPNLATYMQILLSGSVLGVTHTKTPCRQGPPAHSFLDMSKCILPAVP